jgi:hypothetical protein
VRKQDLLDLVDKGYVRIQDSEIKVTMTQRLGSDYIHITQKAANEHTTDHLYAGGFVEYITDEDVSRLEEAVSKVHEKMLKQAEICKQSPLSLSSISGSDYLKSDSGKKYIKQQPAADYFQICVLFNGEPDYPINRPVTIDGELYLPLWSWWLDRGCYMKKQ